MKYQFSFVNALVISICIYIIKPSLACEHSLKGGRPNIADFQEYSNQFIIAYKAWTDKCFAYDKDNKQGSKYPHQVKFHLIKQHLTETDHPPHVSFVLAKRFFMKNGESHDVESEEFRIFHKRNSTVVKKDEQALNFIDGLLYVPHTITKHYECPSLEDVQGMQLPHHYSTIVHQPQGLSLKTLALKVDSDDSLPPKNGYYHILSMEHQPNPYVYSSGRDLFLTSHIGAVCERVNNDFPTRYTFHYVLQTNHKIKLQGGYQTNVLDGFFKEGLYRKDGEDWIKVNQQFEPVAGEQPSKLTHPTQVRFIEDLAFDQAEPNTQLIKGIYAFSELDRVKGLNLAGRSFKEEEQALLTALLKRLNHIESLNLSKKEDGVNYNGLVPLLQELTSLKHLDLTGCSISEENYKKFASRSTLTIIPKPVVKAPKFTPIPISVPAKPEEPPVSTVDIATTSNSGMRPRTDPRNAAKIMYTSSVTVNRQFAYFAGL